MIRDMVYTDIDEIAGLSVRMFAESEEKYTPEGTVERTKALVTRALLDEETLGLVAIKDDVIIGIMYAIIIVNPLTGIREALETMLYVVPECRGSMIGPKLIKAYISWAKEHKVQDISIESSFMPEIKDMTKVGKLYESFGFKLNGLSFKMRID